MLYALSVPINNILTIKKPLVSPTPHEGLENEIYREDRDLHQQKALSLKEEDFKII